MKDFPMKLISLDWFELQKIIRSRGDIYNLSKHVKSRFLSSHRPSWHITRLQLQFKCPTKSIPIFNLNVPQNPLQWSSPISPKLRVPQKFPNFRFGFFIRHKFLNWNLNYSFPNSALFSPSSLPTNWFHIFLLDLLSPSHFFPSFARPSHPRQLFETKKTFKFNVGDFWIFVGLLELRHVNDLPPLSSSNAPIKTRVYLRQTQWI